MKKRLQAVLEKIEDIEFFIEKANGKIMQALRNFITHDYDSVDDEILENVLRVHLPTIKQQVLKAMETK